MTSINVRSCSATCGYRIGMVRVPLAVLGVVDMKTCFPIDHAIDQVVIDRDGVVLRSTSFLVKPVHSATRIPVPSSTTMTGSQWLYIGDLEMNRRKFFCCVMVSAILFFGGAPAPSV